MRHRRACSSRLRVPIVTIAAASIALGAVGVGSLTVAAATGTFSSAPTPVPTITVPAPAPTAADPTPSRSKHGATKKKPKRLTLAELREIAQQLDDDLARRTLELEQAQADADDTRRRLTETRAAAVTARADAEQARVDLGRYAAAAYRGQQLPTDLTVLMAPAGSASQTLRNLQSLEQAGGIKTDIATYAAAIAARADALELEADALAADAARTAELAATKRRDVLATSRENQKRITAEVARVARVQARRAAADCRKKALLAAEYPNGLIPTVLLCGIDRGAYQLRGDAAVAFGKLDAAYQKRFDAPMCVTSAYRTRALQAKLFEDDQVMVAAPGHSHHGLGLALDLCGGIERFGSAPHEWLQKNAARFGWYHPTWAEPDGVTPEPWHWEYGEPR